MTLPHQTRDFGSFYDQSYLQPGDTVALLRDDQFFDCYLIAPNVPHEYAAARIRIWILWCSWGAA
jgi:hypothetical protein